MLKGITRYWWLHEWLNFTDKNKFRNKNCRQTIQIAEKIKSFFKYNFSGWIIVHLYDCIRCILYIVYYDLYDFFSTVCIWEIAKITKIWLFWRNYPENRKKISWRAYSSNIYLSWRKQSVSFQRKYTYWFLCQLQNLRKHKAQSRQQNCADQSLDKIE